jgi:hypothetical protein
MSALAAPRTSAPNAIRVGDVFGRAWESFTAHWLAYCGIMALSYVPLALAMAAMGAGMTTGAKGHAALWIVAAVMAFVILCACMLVTPSAISYGVVQNMRRGDFSLDEAMRVALRRSGALLVLSLLTLLLAMLGLMLFVVPGVIVFCVYAVAAPACIVEGLGPIKSMSRSAFLTKGNRWRVFGILCLLYFGGGSIQQLLKFILNRLLGEVVGLVFALPVEVVFGAFTPAVLGVLYMQLRVAKEGVDVEHITKVFD